MQVYQFKITQKDVTFEIIGYLQSRDPLLAWQLSRQSHLLLTHCNQNAPINHRACMHTQDLEDTKHPSLLLPTYNFENLELARQQPSPCLCPSTLIALVHVATPGFFYACRGSEFRSLCLYGKRSYPRSRLPHHALTLFSPLMTTSHTISFKDFSWL